MSNISYNPYRVALSALVSPAAQQYYVRRSVEDTQALVGGISALVITIGFGLWFVATAAYALERHIATQHQSKNPAATPQENSPNTAPVQKLLPPAKRVPALPPAKEVAPKRRRKPKANEPAITVASENPCEMMTMPPALPRQRKAKGGRKNKAIA